MRQLILVIKAETHKALDELNEADKYPKEVLQDNEIKRAHLYERLKECDRALKMLDNAAKQLTGIGN